MIRGVHHVCLVTEDDARLIAFYRDVIGGELVLETSFEPGNRHADTVVGLKGTSLRVAIIRLGNAYIEIHRYLAPAGRPGDDQRPPNDGGIGHFALDVVDLPAEYERLSAAGVRFLSPPQEMPGIVNTALGRDPDGNLIEFQELLDPTSVVLLPGVAPPAGPGVSC